MHSLDCLVNPAPWSARQYATLCMEPAGEHVLIAQMESVPCGFIVYHLLLDEANIHNIAVHPSQQRLGVARTLVGRALENISAQDASRCLLEVRASNHAAQGLYHSLGFSRDGLRKNYYTSPEGREDGILMSRAL